MGFIGRGGVKLTLPQHILVFKYPSKDRVKQRFCLYAVLCLRNFNIYFSTVVESEIFALEFS